MDGKEGEEEERDAKEGGREDEKGWEEGRERRIGVVKEREKEDEKYNDYTPSPPSSHFPFPYFPSPPRHFSTPHLPHPHLTYLPSPYPQFSNRWTAISK